MERLFAKLPFSEYATKFSNSLIYALLASIALNFFYEPGHIYSSGITGLAQIISTLAKNIGATNFSVGYILICLNIPLFFLGWFKIGHKFTIFTGITVVLTSLFMQLIPTEILTPDPIICAIFGGAVNGGGIGYALKNGISSGGLDFVSITIRKKTGQNVGSISMIFNSMILIASGILFGWKYALYSALGIFVSAKVTDAVFTKQKKVQVTIITMYPDEVISSVQHRLRRGITIINQAKGAYSHEPQTVLLTVVTRYEVPDLRKAMKESDPGAFVSIADNVQILGRFHEEEF
ncbi:MAG TPA: YitT family protein [Candidatus Tetragenococcus pullicola]|nr:YitT family protein [Candidatus Tetragenococcus pullicola]